MDYLWEVRKFLRKIALLQFIPAFFIILAQLKHIVDLRLRLKFCPARRNKFCSYFGAFPIVNCNFDISFFHFFSSGRIFACPRLHSDHLAPKRVIPPMAIQWGNSILNDSLYLGVKNGAVHKIIPTGTELPFIPPFTTTASTTTFSIPNFSDAFCRTSKIG